jgi:hypothetical protein
MEAICSSETEVNFQRTARRYIAQQNFSELCYFGSSHDVNARHFSNADGVRRYIRSRLGIQFRSAGAREGGSSDFRNYDTV